MISRWIALALAGALASMLLTGFWWISRITEENSSLKEANFTLALNAAMSAKRHELLLKEIEENDRRVKELHSELESIRSASDSKKIDTSDNDMEKLMRNRPELLTRMAERATEKLWDELREASK